MTDLTAAPNETDADLRSDEDLSYAQAASDVSAAQRKELAAKVVELRERMERAKESARKATVNFERTVALLASEKPLREDWYEYPGALPRNQLRTAAKLNTNGLHRVMERHRKPKKKR